MSDGSIQLDGVASILFVGNSYTFGRVDPIMHYNAANVHDLTAPVPGTSFANTTGTNPYEPHPWGGVPGVFKAFADEAGLSLDVSLSARNAATLQGHYLNSNPAGWDLRGNVASRSWDTVVLQDNSTQALHSGAGSITFAPGASTATLTLAPVADTKVETDETVGIQLAGGTGYRVGSGAVVSGTILNDDPTGPSVNPALPTVMLAASPSTAIEDDPGGKLVYTFTRTGPTTEPLVVQFAATRDGSTAPSVATTAAGDFKTQGSSIYKFESGGATTPGNVSFTSSTGTVTIAAGATSATLTLLPKADTSVEGDESVHFTLAGSAAYNVGTLGSVTATIQDDDFAPGTDLSLPEVTLNLANTAVLEDGSGSLVWQFARTGATTDALTVDFGVSGTATLPGRDFTVSGATRFATAGASDPDLASFDTYAAKLAAYAKSGAADGTVPANPHANPAADVYLYETWARPNLVTGALVATTNDQTGAVTNTTTTAPEYYASLEDMTADLRAAYEGLAAANPLFKGVAPVGAAFLNAVQNGTALRDPYAPNAGADGKIDLWWDDNLHASKYGSYLSALTLFGTITGVDPRALGAGDKAASDLGIDPATASALQAVAAATVGFSLQAHWTAPGQVTELAGGATGLLATAGAFSFSDSDVTDVHQVSVATETPGALGHLTAVLHSDTTGDGTGGAVDWTYTVDNAAVQGLATGETRVERFAIVVSDQHGGQAQREVAVTINGVGPAAPTVSLAHDTGVSASDHVTSDASLTVIPAESGGALAYSVDGGAPSGSYDPSRLADGAHAVAVTQTDAAGNVSAPATLAFTLDTRAPAAPGLTLAHDTGASASDHLTSDTGVAVTPAESGGVLAYSLDGAAFAPSYDPAHLADGAHVLAVTQTDAAGNTSPAATLAFTLDHTAPQLGPDAATGLGLARPLTGLLLANDADASPLHLASVQFASSLAHAVPSTGSAQVLGEHGLLTVGADGHYSYQPASPGHDVFTETVLDAAGNASTTTLTLDVARAPAPASLALPFALTAGHFDFGQGHALVTAPDGTVTDLTGVGTITFADGSVQEKDGAPGVDDLYYYAHNADVWAAHVAYGLDADAHYAQYGWREGRDPDALFSTSGYLAANPDVAAAAAQGGLDPLQHYDQYGWREGRDPGPGFSSAAYLAANPDVRAAGLDPLAHYLGYGASEGRTTFPGARTAANGDHLEGDFDATYYLAHNPDVAAAVPGGTNPDSFAFQHYLAYGAGEGRAPDALFDGAYYLAHNPDVAGAGVNPLLHYEADGWREGRDPSASFHTDAYLAANPDVAGAQIDPLLHYLQYGQGEGRHLA